MHSRAKGPTKAERERWRYFYAFGCIACLLKGFRNQQFDVHHLLSGHKRRGHAYTIPLCLWHHRGEPILDAGIPEHVARFGPSLAQQSKKFREVFGPDEELLTLTNEQVAQARRIACGASAATPRV